MGRDELPDSKDDEEEKRERFPWQYLLFMVCAVIAVPLYFAMGTISTEALYNKYTFYIILEIASYIVMIMTLVFILMWRVLFKRDQVKIKIFVFYRNMNRWAYAWIALGIGSVLLLEYFVMPILNEAFQTTITFSLILNIVPSLPPNLPPTFAWVPQSLANMVQQLLWQILSVGHSEEIFKVMIIVVGVAVFRKGWKVWVIMAISDAVWSCAHAMLAYGANLAAIAMAMIVGTVFLVQLVRTKCVMVPAITHGWINTILLIPSMGLTWASLGWASLTQPTMTPLVLALVAPWTPALAAYAVAHVSLFSSCRRCRVWATVRRAI